MAYGPITFSRRHVLGDLYSRCDRVESIPVFWNEIDGMTLGHVEQSADNYSDSFTFHLSEELCKKLAGGQVICKFNYKSMTSKVAGAKKRIVLTSFVLTAPVSVKNSQTQAVTALGG